MDTHKASNICTWTLFSFSHIIRSNPGPAQPQYAPAFANNVDPDQSASEEANQSGSALFVIQYMNLCQEPGSSNLNG